MAEKTNLTLVEQTVTVDGIEVHVHVDPSNDYEVAVCSIVLNDEQSTDLEKSQALIRSHKLILGDEYNRVLAELRKKHGGELTTATVVAFVNRVSNKINSLKNSKS